VHSDLKPVNICVQLDEVDLKLIDLKIVDFGSSYKFDSKHMGNMDVNVETLEYLPPEIL